jgi:hypothetical protein
VAPEISNGKGESSEAYPHVVARLADRLRIIEDLRYQWLLTARAPSVGKPSLKAVSASHPEIRFAVMSMSEGRECISASLAGGMHGFVSKRQPDEDVLSAIKEILSGGIYVPWSSVRGEGGAPASEQIVKLTARQQQVLQFLSLGMSVSACWGTAPRQGGHDMRPSGKTAPSSASTEAMGRAARDGTIVAAT